MKIMKRSSPENVAAAAGIIKNGGVVIFPTETVYGMGANAFDADACLRIYRIKGRPSKNPLIVHVAGRAMLGKVARAVPPSAEKLIKKFWPGPLTLVLKKHKRVPAVVTAGLDTVAVRMPANRVALALIKAAGVPIAAPSANLSGKVSPTTHEHVISDFYGRVARRFRLADALLACGPTRHGIESTIVDATSLPPAILRPGSVTHEQIYRELGLPSGRLSAGPSRRIIAPGMLKNHYRPRAPVYLFTSEKKMAASVGRALKTSVSRRGGNRRPAGAVFAVVSRRNAGAFRRLGFSVEEFSGASDLSRKLYGVLRRADAAGAELIFTALLPERGLGRAVNDRLRRAASAVF